MGKWFLWDQSFFLCLVKLQKTVKVTKIPNNAPKMIGFFQLDFQFISSSITIDGTILSIIAILEEEKKNKNERRRKKAVVMKFESELEAIRSDVSLQTLRTKL